MGLMDLVSKPEVVIKCEGATTVKLDDLNDLHHFKRLEDKDYAKGRNSLIERGFKFPFSVWVDEEGKAWTVDGHQRKQILQRMLTEGVKIPDEFPANYIHAKNKEDAAKDILSSESKYGDIVEQDFTSFLEDYGIDFESVEDWANIPDVETDTWEGSEEETGAKAEPKEIECPNCKHKFVPK